MGHPALPLSLAAAIEPQKRDVRLVRTSVVIPAFNEAQSIASTVAAIARFFRTRTSSCEILIVDDGSTDATALAVAALPSDCPVALIQLSRNFGKEAAITAGLEQASGDIVLCVDADGQHPLGTVEKMLRLWELGNDMVYAVRRDRDSETRFKRWGVRWFYRALALGSQVRIPPNAGDFRLMDRKVVDALRSMPERNRFMKGMYAWVGFRSVGVPYDPAPRSNGASSYSNKRLFALASSALTGFSSMPLRAAIAVGLVLALLAFGYGVAVVVETLVFDGTVPGWPTIVASIMFFSGVQLLFIGVLGEYLARIFDEVKARPNYIVARVLRRVRP